MHSVPQRVALIGAGNVAQHLGLWFNQCGVDVVQVWNRTNGKAQSLAERLGAEVVQDLSGLSASVEMVIIAVADDAIAEVSSLIPQSDLLVVHTSGTRPIEDLGSHVRKGVFYPLQTFTGRSEVDFQRIPVCIEGNTPEVEDLLHTCCIQWRMPSFRLNSAQRASLHVAAVIANNFTNFLWGEAFAILNANQIESDILHPLMLETLRKAMHHNPHEVQTGPAVRNDLQTIARHLEYLKYDQNLRDIYELITNQIKAKHRDGEL